MRVLHTGTLDIHAGGPAMSTYYTLYGLRKLGVDAEIYMSPLSPKGRLKGEDVPIHYAPTPLESRFGYSFGYKHNLEKLGICDIYHAQGVWQYPTYVLADVARKFRKPYLITPRGMLYPQDIAKSNALFKKLSLKLRLLSDLNNAACVHATCKEEMMHCRNLGVDSPIAVIPNPVEIRNYSDVKQDSKFRLGYLGRLSPRKNIEALIYAFSELGESVKDAELLIIGGGDKNYEDFLHKEVRRCGLSNVKFTGFLSGLDKDRALASCSVLAMPSEFENLGNVVLEGLVRGKPCIATKGAPWEELETYKCGWWVDFSQSAITEAVKDAIKTPTDVLHQMGKNGRLLMEQHYSIESVSKKMLDVYKWILGVAKRPELVFVD